MAKIKSSKKGPGFGWQAYFLFVVFLNYQWAVNLFKPGSLISNFYLIMQAFHKPMGVYYDLAVVCLILNILCLIPLYGFIFRLKILVPWVWMVVFILRTLSDFCGHYYEFVFVKTLYYDDIVLFYEVLLAGLLVTIPSYIACYLYAFRQKKIFGEDQLEFK